MRRRNPRVRTGARSGRGATASGAGGRECRSRSTSAASCTVSRTRSPSSTTGGAASTASGSGGRPAGSARSLANAESDRGTSSSSSCRTGSSRRWRCWPRSGLGRFPPTCRSVPTRPPFATRPSSAGPGRSSPSSGTAGPEPGNSLSRPRRSARDGRRWRSPATTGPGAGRGRRYRPRRATGATLPPPIRSKGWTTSCSPPAPPGSRRRSCTPPTRLRPSTSPSRSASGSDPMRRSTCRRQSGTA